MSDEDEICGETIDHDERLIDNRDGVRQYECKRCGAEFFEDDEAEDGA